MFFYLSSSALYCLENLGGHGYLSDHLRVEYYVWPHFSGPVLGKVFIDLRRCSSSVKNDPMFVKKADMETVLTAKFTRIK